MKRKLLFFILLLMFFIPVNAKEEKYKIVSGDLETVGSEICFDTECFYVIGNDGNNVKLFAKYNLYVGNEYNAKTRVTTSYGSNATGIQDSSMLGYNRALAVYKGVLAFSDLCYWEDETTYPTTIFNDKSNLYNYVQNYKGYLEEINIAVKEARLITVNELNDLGVVSGSNDDKVSWLLSTSYWTGSAIGPNIVWRVTAPNYLSNGLYSNDNGAINMGIRPVIEVPLEVFDDDGKVYYSSISKIDNNEGVISNSDTSIDVVFNDLEQEIKYQTIIYNDTKQTLYVNDIVAKNLSEKFIDVRLDSKSENMMVESGGSSLVTFYISTLKEEGAGKNIDKKITLNFKLSNKNLNPGTFSNIFEMIILIVILGVVFYFISNKKSKVLLLFIFISLLSINFVYAADYVNVSIPAKVKYVSLNNITSTGTVLNNRNADYTNSKEVWAYYDKVKSIKIKSLISELKKYYKKFDLTENKTGRVIAYLVENGDEKIPYDLIIMSNGAVIANSDSSFMFSFPNVEEVEGLSNVDFGSATTMQGMFVGDKKLVSIDAKSLEMDNTKDTSYMFYDCNKIVHTKSDFNLKNVTNTTMMFTDNLYEDIRLGSKTDSDLNYLSSTGNGIYYIDSTKKDEFPIHFYRGNVSNNNVVFGNYCWDIVRTTDTGGIKLLYNGVPAADGSCNNKGQNSIIGSSKVSTNLYSLAVAGYMYGSDEYKNSNYTITSVSWNNKILSMDNTNNYLYGTSVTYDGTSYTLVNPKNYLWKDNYSNVLGYYTCLSETESTCKSMYYVFHTTNKVMYLAGIYDGDVEKSIHITLYKNIEVNEDGTFNLINPEDIDKAYYSKNHEKYLGYYAPVRKCISNCGTIHIVAATSSTNYTADTTINHKYSNEFTYENGIYTLVDPFISKNGMRLDYDEVSKYKYSCGNTSGTCSELNYITSINNENYYYYYIRLRNGENIETALSKMNINSNDSLIKTQIDDWFKNNMLSYKEKLEDAVWYNDRSFLSGNLSGTGMTNGVSMFSSYFKICNKKLNSFDYKNKNDMFTVKNNKGNCSLEYPVGTITVDELSYAGAGINGAITNNYLDIDTNWWTMSPATYSNTVINYVSVSSSGIATSARCDRSYGLRPMISLKNDVLYTRGDGTVNNPYVIE